MREEKPQKSSRWGFGIAALYGGFVLFILVIVGYASMQRFELVDRNYYERGLDYQQQLQRINRVRALPEQPRFEYDTTSGEVVVHMPHVFTPHSVNGTLTFFRPSAAILDFSVPLDLAADCTQRIVSSKLVAGKWRTKLAWTADGVEYYDEQELLLE